MVYNRPLRRRRRYLVPCVYEKIVRLEKLEALR